MNYYFLPEAAFADHVILYKYKDNVILQNYEGGYFYTLDGNKINLDIRDLDSGICYWLPYAFFKEFLIESPFTLESSYEDVYNYFNILTIK